MKSGYDHFFKNAKRAANGEPPVIKATDKKNIKSSNKNSGLVSSKPAVVSTRRKKTPFPLAQLLWAIVGFIVAGYGFVNHDKLETWIGKIEVQFLATAAAETPAESKNNETKKTEEVATAKTDKIDEKVQRQDAETLDHLSKLNERKKELDAKEEELARVETELQKQREELEARLRDLNGVREKISGILEERVKVDEQKVDNLVQMFSTMKPPQAAKVFESLDEDLAIDIMSKMKKKNAAEIMNLLKPEKAKVISEKYAGYKRGQ